MNASFHASSPSEMPVLSHEASDVLSSSDIQVFARRASAPSSFEDEWHDSEDFDSELAVSSQPEDEAMYQSFLRELNAPQSTLTGRVIFWTGSSICIAALLVMALTQIWAHGQATRLGFAYSQASKQATRLKEDQRLLKLQLAKLRSPGRLYKIARQQLGMKLPARTQVISEDQVVQKLQQQPTRGGRPRVQLASTKSQFLVR